MSTPAEPPGCADVGRGAGQDAQRPWTIGAAGTAASGFGPSSAKAAPRPGPSTSAARLGGRRSRQPCARPPRPPRPLRAPAADRRRRCARRPAGDAAGKPSSARARQLGVEEARVVVVARAATTAGRVGPVGLDEHAPRPIAAARPAPRPARAAGSVRSEARKSGRLSPVSAQQHADQRHAREVVALGHHLRADEDVDLARARRASSTRLEPRAAARRRDRAARRARVGNAAATALLDLLGAEPLALDRAGRAAARARLGHALE